MRDDTEKHGPVVNIVNRFNQFRTTAEPNLNNYYNELMKFSEPFATIFLRDKTRFYLQDHDMNSYEILLC